MKKFSTVAAFLAASFFVQAQNGATPELLDFPPNAEPGKCYAKCKIPAVFETQTERILVKPEGKRLKTIPAKYETQTFKVLAKEAYVVKKVIPATYKTTSEEVLVHEGTSKMKTIPETYETVSEKMLVAPAKTEWVKGKADANCLSANPEDCNVWCLKEVPAQYKTVYKRVLKTPAKYEEVKTEPVYKTVYTKVVDQPARVVEETIPAKYKTESRKVLVEPSKAVEEVVPAEYKTVTKRVMVSAETVGEWKEILCDSKLTSSKISQIQRALINAGYDVGSHGVDNVFGADTKRALTQYQKDNNLPVGNLNLETLKSLKVSY